MLVQAGRVYSHTHILFIILYLMLFKHYACANMNVPVRYVHWNPEMQAFINQMSLY